MIRTVVATPKAEELLKEWLASEGESKCISYLDAVFLAACNGKPVTMGQLIQELEKVLDYDVGVTDKLLALEKKLLVTIIREITSETRVTLKMAYAAVASNLPLGTVAFVGSGVTEKVYKGLGQNGIYYLGHGLTVELA